MEQDTYQPPFYCNMNFTCLVSVHAQTLNEYPDTDLDVHFADNYPDNRVSIPALIPTDFTGKKSC